MIQKQVAIAIDNIIRIRGFFPGIITNLYFFIFIIIKKRFEYKSFVEGSCYPLCYLRIVEV